MYNLVSIDVSAAIWSLGMCSFEMYKYVNMSFFKLWMRNRFLKQDSNLEKY